MVKHTTHIWRSVEKTFLFFAIFMPTICFAQPDIHERKKIGLVLSGGGARGLAHVGVIKVLDEQNIPIDYIAGTSMGAIVGGIYASGMDASDLERTFALADWPALLDDKPPRAERTFRRKRDDEGFLVNFDMGTNSEALLFPRGLVQGQTLSLEIRKLLTEVATIDDFDQLPIPFRAIAADIVTGEEVVLDSGDLAKSIRASMSVPGVFTPIEINGQLLVDGGIVNNLPINIVKDMGAEIVIVVDVGPSLVPAEELGSPLSVSSQMLAILMKEQTDQQKQKMLPTDLLISPKMGDIQGTSFEQAARAIELGEQAARLVVEDIRELSMPKSSYAEHREQLQQRRRLPPDIREVVIENESRLSPKVLQAHLSDHAGRALSVAQLENDIGLIYGFETFETVDYSVEKSGDEYDLLISGNSKDWGPNYVRFGANLEEDFSGNSDFNVGARLTRTEINPLGGEIRAEAALGESPAFSVELYQPLDYRSRWFANPQLEFQSNSTRLFDGENQIARSRSRQTNLSLGLGRNLSNWGEIRFSLARSFNRGDIEIGDPALGDSSSALTSSNLGFSYDTLNDISIPITGSNFSLDWLALRKGFGAEQSLDALNLFYLKPNTWGKNTFLHWWNLGSVVNEGNEPFNAFNLGGLFNLSGYSADELNGQHQAIGRVLYYRRLGDTAGPLLNTSIYMGASLEAGNVWQDKDNIRLNDSVFAGSLFLAMDTAIGPIYLAYGVAEGGRDSAYLFLGQTF